MPQPEGGSIRAIWIRDAKRCHICGYGVLLAEASRDHVEPKSAGGYDKATNYALAHKRCNSARGSLTMDEVRRVIASLGEKPTMAQVINGLKVAKGARDRAVFGAVAVHRPWCSSRRKRWPKNDVWLPCDCEPLELTS